MLYSLDSTQCPHKANEYKFLLVGQYLYIHDKDTKAMVCLPDANFFDIIFGVLAPFLFIICLNYPQMLHIKLVRSIIDMLCSIQMKS